METKQYVTHSEYVFDLQEMRDMVNNNQIHPTSNSVSFTIIVRENAEDKVFETKVQATVVQIDEEGNRIPSIVESIYACPRPPGCGK